MERHYSTTTRRDYIESQLPRYRVDEKSGHSLRDIAWDIKQAFGLETPPSPSTITSDLAEIENRKTTHRRSDRATELLLPENFPEWRATFYRNRNGEPYETPTHQFAWFWLIYCLATKNPLPQWVIDWYAEHDADLSDINEWVHTKKMLLTLWLLAPARHGKTDLFRHAVIWLICYDPNIRIMWQSLNLPVAKLTTSWIKRELESNQELIALYGPFQSDGTWSDKEFIVATRTINLASPTIVALGKTEGTLSRDADLIVIDDFVDEKSSISPTQVERDVSNVKSQVLTRRETWTPVLGIGSHQKSEYGDAYEYMEEHEKEQEVEGASAKTYFVKIKAHDYTKCKVGSDFTEDERHGQWCLLWPTVRPHWFLEAQRHDLGEIAFELIYNQESKRTGVVFFREEVVKGSFPIPRYDDELKRFADATLTDPENPPGILDRTRSYGEVPACCNRSPNALFRALGFDPAAGETRHAAESSLHVLAACRFCLRRYVIEEWHDRVSPERHPDIIDSYAAITRPHRARIEINAYQKSLARDPRLRRSASQRKYSIDEWRTDERRDDPTIGVAYLHNHMEAGRFSLPYKTAMDQQRSQTVMRQMLRWPKTPNDQMFSLWLAEGCVARLLEEAEHEAPTLMPGYEHLPAYLRAERRTIDLFDLERG